MGSTTAQQPATKSVSTLITKAVVEGEKTVRAIVSAPTVDRDFDIVDNASLRLPLKSGGTIAARDLTGSEELDIPWLIDHDFSVENVIGSVKSAKLNDSQELEVIFRLSSLAKAQDVYTLLEEGHLNNAFSITFNDYEYIDGAIYNGEILEISAVWRGSNKDARLLALSKSLQKGESMANAKELELDAKANKVDETAVEQPTVEAPKTTDEVVVAEAVAPEVSEAVQPEAEQPEQVVEPPAVEAPALVETPAAEVPAEDDATSKSINKETSTMSKTQEVAIEGVVAKAPSVIEQPTMSKTLDKNAIRKNFVLQVASIASNDDAALAGFNSKAMELAGVESKVIDRASGSALFMSQVVADDIQTEYTNLGRVGQLVDRVDINGAETYKMLVEAKGTGFAPVALGGTKAQDQPIWTPKTFEPFEWAIIVPWLDGVAKRTPIAVYNQLVRYIANEYARLEDKVIISYAGGVVGGETRPATGLVPVLTAAAGDRVVAYANYTAAAVVAALGTAYGSVESDGAISVITNRSTWAKLATSADTAGRPIFTVTGEQVSAGALGTFNVVLSQEVPADRIIVGDLSDYLLVTRGGLETLYSREATVGALNLFTSDASALRADANITGGVKKLSSFVLLSKTVTV